MGERGHLRALAGELGRKLPNRGGLSGTVDADNKNHCWPPSQSQLSRLASRVEELNDAGLGKVGVGGTILVQFYLQVFPHIPCDPCLQKLSVLHTVPIGL